MKNKSCGSLEVVCGSMFSGKSEELIRKIRRAIFGQKNVQVFKHSLDDRYNVTLIHSHNGTSINAVPISTHEALLELIAPQTEIIGIDEIQFFSNDIIFIIDELVKQGKHVIVAGLDLDFRGIPFGPVPYLMAMADSVTKLRAVCVKTGLDAHFTQRLINGRPASAYDPVILIGESNFYEARSREAFEIDEVPLKDYLQNK